MLEISSSDIGELSDGDLRELVGRLCEAELLAKGLPTAGVTWGGHQDAKDGGIDVRVDVTSTLHPDSYIPKSITGFQVKKSSMARAAIINEMKPGGNLRQSIENLVNCNGAYIIVSGQDSTTDTSLTDRINAMREAISSLPDASNINLDFYDGNRIASWARSHPSLILWIRDKLGKPIHGWRAYGNWSNSRGGIEEEYLIDDGARIHNGTALGPEGMSIINGINMLRTTLLRPGASVRLVGLSGVGKTRLLQALFDPRIGQNALNPSFVFYTDVGDAPHPDPRTFAEYLITLKRPAILAIDNCPPELHRRLTSVCSASGSYVSVITIEYDVKEDQPEETVVFRLEPASIELIEKMIQARFKTIGQVDARSIANFSGGNARIAIALANTIKQDESLSNLKDEDLFKRLFHQRNYQNNSLLRSAEIFSLVYSFDCQTGDGVDLELKTLGAIAGKSINELFSDITELERRELIQKRHVWRAVLPHAIANKLAKRALENTPTKSLLEAFEQSGSERLLKSFSRRLSYLNGCKQAHDIAESWLGQNGLLNDISNLNDLGINLFKNISSINPALTLAAIEKTATQDKENVFLSRKNQYHSEFTKIIRSLAYDENLFERSVKLLCAIALTEKPDEKVDSVRSSLISLFHIHLSGTHASPEQRLKIVKKLMDSDCEDENILGISLLNAALKTSHFNASFTFEFGSHPRNYGYYPKTQEDVRHWFNLFIKYAVEISCANKPISAMARSVLAKNIRCLWSNAGIVDQLEDAIKTIAQNGPWREGWLAIRTILRFDKGEDLSENRARLDSLNELLKPVTLVERVRLYTMASYGSSFDLDDSVNEDGEMSSFEKVERTARALGKELSKNAVTLTELLPEILSENGPRLFSFGQGLAEGCQDPLKMWDDFKIQLALLDPSKRNYSAPLGFLYTISEINPVISEKILVDAFSDDLLSSVYPMLQANVKINQAGFERLKKSIELGLTPIENYAALNHLRDDGLWEKELAELLKLIASKPNGLEISFEILNIKLHQLKHNQPSIGKEIISCGIELLSKIKFARNSHPNGDRDYALGQMIEICFNDHLATDNARIMCRDLAAAFSCYDIYVMDYGYTLEALCKTQPIAFLDGFLDDDLEPGREIERVFSYDLQIRSSPVSSIEDELIINWCEANPGVRYPRVAAVISPYQSGENGSGLDWTPLALKIISNAPDCIAVLNEFKDKFRPMSWSGSRAEIMKERLTLISKLKNHGNRQIADWALEEEIAFEEEIKAERNWEWQKNDARHESFE